MKLKLMVLLDYDSEKHMRRLCELLMVEILVRSISSIKGDLKLMLILNNKFFSNLLIATKETSFKDGLINRVWNAAADSQNLSNFFQLFCQPSPNQATCIPFTMSSSFISCLENGKFGENISIYATFNSRRTRASPAQNTHVFVINPHKSLTNIAKKCIGPQNASGYWDLLEKLKIIYIQKQLLYQEDFKTVLLEFIGMEPLKRPETNDDIIQSIKVFESHVKKKFVNLTQLQKIFDLMIDIISQTNYSDLVPTKTCITFTDNTSLRVQIKTADDFMRVMSTSFSPTYSYQGLAVKQFFPHPIIQKLFTLLLATDYENINLSYEHDNRLPLKEIVYNHFTMQYTLSFLEKYILKQIANFIGSHSHPISSSFWVNTRVGGGHPRDVLILVQKLRSVTRSMLVSCSLKSLQKACRDSGLTGPLRTKEDCIKAFFNERRRLFRRMRNKLVA